MLTNPEVGKNCLRVPVEPVVGLGRKPTVDVIPISHQKAAGICSLLTDAVAVGIFGVKAGALQTDFGTLLLSDGCNSKDRKNTECQDNDALPRTSSTR